jgi:hypothetical protein
LAILPLRGTADRSSVSVHPVPQDHRAILAIRSFLAFPVIPSPLATMVTPFLPVILAPSAIMVTPFLPVILSPLAIRATKVTHIPLAIPIRSIHRAITATPTPLPAVASDIEVPLVFASNSRMHLSHTRRQQDFLLFLARGVAASWEFI